MPNNKGANKPQVLVFRPHSEQSTKAAAIWGTAQLVEPKLFIRILSFQIFEARIW